MNQQWTVAFLITNINKDYFLLLLLLISVSWQGIISNVHLSLFLSFSSNISILYQFYFNKKKIFLIVIVNNSTGMN